MKGRLFANVMKPPNLIQNEETKNEELKNILRAGVEDI